MSFSKVISTYDVRGLFREAIAACPDITKDKFPNLFKNKSTKQKSGNITKIQKQCYKLIMIAMARLYKAHTVCLSLALTTGCRFQPHFDFKHYDPHLQTYCEILEEHLQDRLVTPIKSPPTNKTDTELVHEIRNELNRCKKTSTSVTARLDRMDTSLAVLEKRMKEVKPAKREASIADTKLDFIYEQFLKMNKEE